MEAMVMVNQAAESETQQNRSRSRRKSCVAEYTVRRRVYVLQHAPAYVLDIAAVYIALLSFTAQCRACRHTPTSIPGVARLSHNAENLLIKTSHRRANDNMICCWEAYKQGVPHSSVVSSRRTWPIHAPDNRPGQPEQTPKKINTPHGFTARLLFSPVVLLSRGMNPMTKTCAAVELHCCWCAAAYQTWTETI